MRVLLADSSNESACGCGALLREVEPSATIYRALSLRDTLSLVKDYPHLDMIVWHSCVQTEEKYRLVRCLADLAMGIPIVIFSKETGPLHVAMAIQSGANGYILLPKRKALIVEILRLVLSGGSYFPASMLIDRIREGSGCGARKSIQDDGRRDLTPRQKDVLQLLAEGRTNRQIADTLGIAEATAKLHVSALLRAMDVRTRDEAIQLRRPDIALAN